MADDRSDRVWGDGFDVTRRRLLKRAGAGAFVVAAGPLLAACGSTGNETSSTEQGDTKAPAANADGDVTARLREILDVPTGKAAGEGLTIPVGASLAFSGPYSIFGKADHTGMQLAAAHIKALGGPTFDIRARDNGLVDSAKGVANVREWGAGGVPVVLTSGAATVYSEMPYYKQYSMIAFEPGGATKAAEGLPFFYQTRSEFSDDSLPGIIEYIKQNHPDFKRVTYAALDYGAQVNDTQEAPVKAAAESAGWDYAGRVLASPTDTNYSAMLSAIRKADPDFILCLFSASTLGVFMKQYATSGLKAQVIGFDFTPDAAQIAGPAMEGYEFAFDFFNADAPENDWAKLFTEEYTAANKDAPTYYSANYYETLFYVWQLVRSVIADGGDPAKQGTAYVDAIAKNLSFPSLYGAGGATGTKELDAKTHSLTSVPMVYARVGADGKPEVLASFNKNAADYKAV